eukprot:scaffold402_cov70-Skeletonema_dohrnii-CCMP3373.AAC.5
MVSRKKAKGKARKAVKAMKEEEKDAHDDSSTAATQQRGQEGEGALGAQMQRLINIRPCKHGFDPFPKGHICDRFLKLYFATYYAGSSSPPDAVMEAMNAVENEYPEVLRDSSKMKAILSYFLMEGTHHILNGDKKTARTTAARIIMFEEFIAFSVLKTQAVLHLQKVLEMLIADDHTLVSFFRKRITCSCLDKKHKEVKSIKKMGFCNNDNCPLPGRKVERSKMLCCTRCGDHYYCSRDCQKAAWSEHREECKIRAEKNAKFERIRDHVHDSV